MEQVHLDGLARHDLRLTRSTDSMDHVAGLPHILYFVGSSHKTPSRRRRRCLLQNACIYLQVSSFVFVSQVLLLLGSGWTAHHQHISCGVGAADRLRLHVASWSMHRSHNQDIVTHLRRIWLQHSHMQHLGAMATEKPRHAVLVQVAKEAGTSRASAAGCLHTMLHHTIWFCIIFLYYTIPKHNFRPGIRELEK